MGSPSPTSSPSTKPKSHHHVVIFPFMSQGHTLPLLDLSKSFSNLNLTVTIITTPANAAQIQSSISKYPNIHLKQIPFPQIQELATPCENTNELPSMSYLPQFFEATAKLEEPFEQVLQEMKDSSSLPICVISDYFLGFTVDTCRKFNVPRVVFTGMGVLSMVISKCMIVHAVNSGFNFEESIQFSGLTLPFDMTRDEIQEPLASISHPDPDPDNPINRVLGDMVKSETSSWGVIVNSFAELESDYVANLESNYTQDGAKAWCLGPLFLHHEMDGADDPDEMIQWLDEQEDTSVVYVSFGTQAGLSDLQLDEVIQGLAMSIHPFIFVVRSKTWVLPDGLEEKPKGKGWVTRDWVNQRRILSHKAIGGFVSHCGWNSVLESIASQVPILAWPMMAEQPLNARLVVDVFGIGMKMPMGGACKVGDRDEVVGVGRGDICKGVDELMKSEKGVEAREKVKRLGEAARYAVQKDGSSFKCLTGFIDALTEVANEKQ